MTVPPQEVIAHKNAVSVREGGVIRLQCLAKSAKPPAVITWYNGTVPVVDADTTVNIQVRYLISVCLSLIQLSLSIYLCITCVLVQQPGNDWDWFLF